MPDSLPIKKWFKCKICKKTYDKPQSLGGHYSKAHPEQSRIYKQKQVTRDKNANKRELLKYAKLLFAGKTPEKQIAGMDKKSLQSGYYKKRNELLRHNTVLALPKYDSTFAKSELAKIMK